MSRLVPITAKFNTGIENGTNKLHITGDGKKGLLYCVLLALQFGFQPMIARKFTNPGVSKTSVVIATEFSKIVISLISIL